MRKRIHRPSPATIIATTALVVAAIGTVSSSWADPRSGPVASAAKKTSVSLAPRPATLSVKPGSVGTLQATCPSGTTAIGGGYSLVGDSVYAHVSLAGVSPRNNSYIATIINPPANLAAGIPAQDSGLTVQALCAKNNTPIIVNGIQR